MATLIDNRVAKARRYIDYLDTNLPDDIDLGGALLIDWARVAELAGEQIPSESTRAAILVGLRERRSTDSPLLGLPQ